MVALFRNKKIYDNRDVFSFGTVSGVILTIFVVLFMRVMGWF